MSGLPISQELQQLVSKYADMSTPVDFLRALSQAAKLEEANILLHERMARDVYTIFGKTEDSGEMVSETGKKLLSSSKVIHFHQASSTLVFHTEAEVQFNMAEDQASSKRKRGKVATSAIDEPVFLKVHFSEQTLGAGSGTEPGSATREKGVSVLEAPYKSINLIISMRRGHAGLDQATVVDFQLLTSGRSPSTQRISLQELKAQNPEMDDEEGENCEEDSNGSCGDSERSDGEGVNGAGDEKDGDGVEEEWEFEHPECEDSEGEEGEEEEEEEDEDSEGSEGSSNGKDDDGSSQSDEYDTADYYNVNVDTEALTLVSSLHSFIKRQPRHVNFTLFFLSQLKNWLGFKSLLEQQEEDLEEEARVAAEEEEEKARKKNKKSSADVGAATTKGKGKGGKGKVVAPPSPEESEDEEDAGSDAEEGDGEEIEGEEIELEGEPSAYDLDPALGDLLQFLLSLPYVDEAWGIHDLILVSTARCVA